MSTIKHSLGHSCSSKSSVPGVSTDPTTSIVKESTFQDPSNLVQPFPKFSIRDYVFASRSKGIERNWPFDSKSLEVCLKHGVKDLLPPFAPSKSILSQCFNAFSGIENNVACSKDNTSVGHVKARGNGSANLNTSNINFKLGQPADESLCLSQCTSLKAGKFVVDQVENANESDHIVMVIPANIEASTKGVFQSKVGVTSWRSKKLDSSQVLSEKRCNLAAKLGSKETEEVAANSNKVLDPMASKLCPICEVFASTSNTTLNSHMDQCLESNTEVVQTVFMKPKVKPRKKRSIMDILMETKNRDICIENHDSQVAYKPRYDKTEGDICVNSNGIKARMLSKSSDANFSLKDEPSPRKVTKHVVSKSISRRNMTSKPKIFKNKNIKVRSSTNGCIHEHTSGEKEKEKDPTTRVRKPIKIIGHADPENTRQQLWSKRLGITNRKLTNEASDGITPRRQKFARKCKLGSDGSQRLGSHSDAFCSQSPEEMVITSKDNNDNQRRSSLRLLKSIPTLSSKSTPSTSVLRRVPRSAAILANKKIKEIGRIESCEYNNYDTMRNSSDGPSMLASTFKKFCKHKSLLRTTRHELSIHSFGRNHGPISKQANKKFRVNKEISKKDAKYTQIDITNTDISYGCDGPTLGKLDDKHDLEQQEGRPQTDHGGEELETEIQYALDSRSNHVDHINETSSGYLSPINNKTTCDILAGGYNLAVEDECSEKLTHDVHISNIIANNDEVDKWQIDPYPTKESCINLTNNRNMDLEAPQDKMSVMSNIEGCNQDHGLAFDSGPFGSPISTTPVMSAPDVLKGSGINESESSPSIINYMTAEKHISRISSEETKLRPSEKDENPYCCNQDNMSGESKLHHQSITTKPVPSFTGRQVPHLSIGLQGVSSFRTYQRTSTKEKPSLDSPDQALSASVEPTMSSPSYMTNYASPSLQTQLPSQSNPFLEETVHRQAPWSDCIVRGNYMGHVGFMPPNNQHIIGSEFMNTDPSTTGHHISPTSVQASNYSGPSLHTSSMIQPNYLSSGSTMQADNLYNSSMGQSGYIPISSMMSYAYRCPHMPHGNLEMHHLPYKLKEVIMNNGSPQHISGQQVDVFLPVASSPTTTSSQNNVLTIPFFNSSPRESADGSVPVFANFSPMVGVSSTSQGSNSEVENSYMSSSNIPDVHSPTGYINPTVYYLLN